MSKTQELPEGWADVSIGDVVRPSRIGVQPSLYPDLAYVGMEHVESETMRLLGTVPANELKSTALHFWPGDVLYGRLRPYLNKVLRADFEGLCSAEFIVFRESEHSDHIDMRYLQYFLNSWAFKQFASHLNEGDRPRVDWDQLKGYRFPLAPLAEQRRIVATIEQQFTRLDAGMAALRRARVALKRYRAAVLKAAVEGRLTEQWRAEHPDVEAAPVLLGRILAERQLRWEADLRVRGKDAAKARYEEPKGPDVGSLPELPEGWCWATVEQIIKRSEYGTSVKCAYEAKGIPVLRIPNIAAGEIDLSDVKYATVPLHMDKEDELLFGDVLMCRTNGSVSLIGKTAVIKYPFDEPHTFASYLLRFRFAASRVLPNWYHLFASSPQGRKFIEGNAASSAGQHNISLSLIHRLSLPLPPLAEQEQIVAEVERRLSVVGELEATVEANLKRAERLRQSILREAFAGRLVAQDASDEPAGVLLEGIRGVGAQIMKNGHVKSSKPEFAAEQTIEPISAVQNTLW